MGNENQRVHFVARESVTKMVQLANTYKLNPDKVTLSYAERLAWWFLRKTGVVQHATVEKVDYTYHVIDKGAFLKNLNAECHSLLWEYRREPRRLLIGSEDYARLMSSPEMTGCEFAFNIDYRGEHTILGLRVEVIPWMRGILVMP